MRIALFGATGFVGSYIVQELINNSHELNVLARDGSKLIIEKNCQIIIGDINNKEAVYKTIENTDVIIYNIGIIREFPKEKIEFSELHYEGVKSCINLAKKLKVNRFILMSANGVKEVGTKYQISKFHAEKELINTGLDWTIFRPSLIFGPPLSPKHQEFCTQLRDTMLRLPLPAPLFYEGLFPYRVGQFSMSPIHVKNVAQFFAKALLKNDTVGKKYNLGGIKTFSWRDIIRVIGNSSGESTWQIPVPVVSVKLIASFLDRYKWFPVTRDQLTMLLEGNTVVEQYFIDFGIEPIEFDENSLSYLMG